LKGETADLYKVAKAGDVLIGKLSFGPAHPKGACSLTYVLPPQVKEPEEDTGDKEKPLLIDLQLTLVDKIKDEAEKRAYLDGLIATNPTHLPLLVASLKATKEAADLEKTVAAADAILACIDEKELAAYLGRKALPADEQSDDDKKLKKEMDIQKSAWTLAYSRKLLSSYQAANTDTADRAQLFLRYRAFLDNPDKDPEFGLISAKRDIAAQVCVDCCCKPNGKLLTCFSDSSDSVLLSKRCKRCSMTVHQATSTKRLST
jgi:hypothetical protein